MKRLLLALVILLVIALPALAQEGEVITLDAATPAIDVAISLPPDTTGTIALSLNSAAVTLTDATSMVVFSAADPRLHALEFNIAPNTGAHTLTIERLPGVAQAQVSIQSLPELPRPGSAALVQSDVVSLNQEVSLPLDASHPGDTIGIHLAPDVAGLISTSFPGANALAQLFDPQGVVVVEALNGHVDGMNMVIDGGDYDFTLIARNLTQPITTGVRAVPAGDAGYTLLPTPATETVTISAEACTAAVTESSVNLRSGPGTGYSILQYGYRDEVYPVGGVNPADNWVVIATDSGSAWMSRSVARLSGSCTQLPVFNVPLRDAQPAPIIVVTPEPQVIVQTVNSGSSQSSSSRSHDDDDDKHDDDEHDDEHEDDDDD